MNAPKKPEDPPSTNTPNPRVEKDGGIPPGAAEEEAKGYPTSDRQETETAPAR